MKSLKIAALGVAAFGLAALPVAGVFAEAVNPTTVHKDQLTINVNPVCTFGTLSDGHYVQDDKAYHASGNYTNDQANNTSTAGGTWTNGTFNTTAGFRTDSLSVTMQPGTSSDNIGQTTLVVRCNNAAGFKISAAGEDLANTTEGKTSTIPAGDGASWTAESTTSYWNMNMASTDMVAAAGYTLGTAFAAPDSETPIAQTSAAGDLTDGEELTITYGAGINNTQEAGTYSGLVTYTLAQLDAVSSKKSEDPAPSPAPQRSRRSREPVVDQNSEQLDQLSQDLQNLGDKVSELNDKLDSLNTQGTQTDNQGQTEPTVQSEPAPEVTNVYNTYYTGGGATTPTETTPTETIAEKPAQEGNTTGNITTNSTDANSTKGDALGALSKSGGSSAAKEVESSDNTGMIVALVAVGAAAAAATGAYLYTKNQED